MKIILEKGQKLFFTSDTHYNHANICSATTKWTDPVTCREFKTLEHMNAHIVSNINEVVGQDDILIHLGDWSFGGFEQIERFRNEIFCKNVHIITGNHDHHIENNKEDCQDRKSVV
jgi:calcineurin-like phosphoesterase family protein